MSLASPVSSDPTTQAGDWFIAAGELFKLYAIPFLWQMLGALAIWIIGGILIRFASRMVGAAMTARNLDRTLTSYVTSALSIILRVVLIAGVLGMFGVESTSFAALLAAAGVAIGMAWSGLLANFAAGVFLVLLRPFKVGDVITAAGVTGMVVEIGLFATTLDTRDNVRIFVGNNKLFADNIINLSHNPYSRTELLVQLAHGVDPFEVAARIAPRIAQIPHVMAEPAPEVGVLEYNASGTLLYVRPYVAGGQLEVVRPLAFRVIAEATAGLPVPATHAVHQAPR